MKCVAFYLRIIKLKIPNICFCEKILNNVVTVLTFKSTKNRLPLLILPYKVNHLFYILWQE